jgi:hypothetical protein
VCTIPVSSSPTSSSSSSTTTITKLSKLGSTRLRRGRQLQQQQLEEPTQPAQPYLPIPVKVFAWRGGGGCRGCYCDCKDQRRILQFYTNDNDGNDNENNRMVWGTTEWFLQQFTPQLESSITNATFTKIVPKYGSCLGLSPIVNVQIVRISISQLKSQFQCYNGRLMALLPTMSLNNIAPIDHNCPTCVTIDFSQTSNKTILLGGTYVSDQWKADNVMIQVSYPSLNPRGKAKARILDTSNITCLQQYHAEDFGSPNQSCPQGGDGSSGGGGGGGGIGLGNGGLVGSMGTNCNPIGSKFYDTSRLINSLFS